MLVNLIPALSLSPALALGCLSGYDKTCEILHSPQWQLPQKLLIHSLGYPDDQMDREVVAEVMDEFGFCPETFPAFAIQGVAEVICHGLPELYILESYFLPEPIYDVLPPGDTRSGSLWLPQTPEQAQAFRWAIQELPTV